MVDIKSVEQLIQVVSGQGLWFFVLYIIYHYLGQLFTAVVVLRIISQCIKIVNSWVIGWFTLKGLPRLKMFGIYRVEKDKDSKVYSTESFELDGKLVCPAYLSCWETYGPKGQVYVQLCDKNGDAKNERMYVVPVSWLKLVK